VPRWLPSFHLNYADARASAQKIDNVEVGRAHEHFLAGLTVDEPETPASQCSLKAPRKVMPPSNHRDGGGIFGSPDSLRSAMRVPDRAFHAYLLAGCWAGLRRVSEASGQATLWQLCGTRSASVSN
jgi:hypothetical protein